MIYLDMFFLFLCKEKVDEEQEIEFVMNIVEAWMDRKDEEVEAAIKRLSRKS